MRASRAPRWARRRASWRALGASLNSFAERFPAAERLAADPVHLAHGRAPADAEVAALVASALAFGNARALIGKARAALEPLGPGLAEAVMSLSPDRPPPHLAAGRWTHRWIRAPDMAWLLGCVGATLREHGTLRAAFTRHLDLADDSLLAPMRSFVTSILAAGERAGWGPPDSLGRAHLLPIPDGAGASKRLCLFLRWMARPADGVDLGLWPEVGTRRLTIPLDVHVARIGAYVGLTDRRTPGWRMAREITRNLARFDAEDPTRFDFALSHLGIMGGCPRRRDPRRCSACDLLPICRL